MQTFAFDTSRIKEIYYRLLIKDFGMAICLIGFFGYGILTSNETNILSYIAVGCMLIFAVGLTWGGAHQKLRYYKGLQVVIDDTTITYRNYDNNDVYIYLKDISKIIQRPDGLHVITPYDEAYMHILPQMQQYNDIVTALGKIKPIKRQGYINPNSLRIVLYIGLLTLLFFWGNAIEQLPYLNIILVIGLVAYAVYKIIRTYRSPYATKAQKMSSWIMLLILAFLAYIFLLSYLS